MIGMALPAGSEVVVATTSGRIAGEAGDGILRWLGIPYAAPPVGPLRFRPPQAVEPWSGVRTAMAVGPSAWQSRVADPFTGQLRDDRFDEDCLSVNVTAPDRPGAEGRGYPVLVSVHGGGYAQGSGAAAPIGDGAGLARRGLVVVTFNYRLGSLGFLDLRGLSGWGNEDSGCAGLLDQVAALRWVRDNVASFGGDPARVTAYGISAGGKSIVNLMTSPLAVGLFQRAIVASGGGDHVANPAFASRLRIRLLSLLGLHESDTDVDTLLSISPKEFVAAQEAIATGPRGTWIWRPSTATAALPSVPIEAVARGAASGVALLVGNNGHEGATFHLGDPTAGLEAEGSLTRLFGETRARVLLDAYKHALPGADASTVGLAVLGDERYGVPTRRLAEAQATHAAVWRYRYDGLPPGVPEALSGGHGMDGLAIWGADTFASTPEAREPQTALCLAMAQMVADFVIFGTPRPGDSSVLPQWDRYDSTREATMILDASPHLEAAPDRVLHSSWPEGSWSSGTWWPLDGI